MRETWVRPVDILMAEDSRGDVRLTQEALSESTVPHHLHVVPDGEAALAFLRRHGTYASAPRPDLILLDLNMPRRDGREVLAELKGDPSLRRIPVIVLTSSRAEQDILDAYELHANCYVTKPIGLDPYIHVVRVIEQFWLTVATLPPGSAGRVARL